MSDPIKVGDLVQIVHDCCNGELLGHVYVVEELAQDLICERCDHFHSGQVARLPDAEDNGWWPSAWLKRIPPLSELDDVKRDEEITA